jgi:hypothetical protein
MSKSSEHVQPETNAFGPGAHVDFAEPNAAHRDTGKFDMKAYLEKQGIKTHGGQNPNTLLGYNRSVMKKALEEVIERRGATKVYGAMDKSVGENIKLTVQNTASAGVTSPNYSEIEIGQQEIASKQKRALETVRSMTWLEDPRVTTILISPRRDTAKKASKNSAR